VHTKRRNSTAPNWSVVEKIYYSSCSATKISTDKEGFKKDFTDYHY
jgi:hypothetical protein